MQSTKQSEYVVFDHIFIDSGTYTCIPKGIAIRKTDILVIKSLGRRAVRLSNGDIYRSDAYIFRIAFGKDGLTTYDVSVNEIDTVQKMIKYINEYEDSSME